MRMRRMSDREIKLLLAVLIIAILFGAYQSGYQHFHRKASGLKSENSNMLIQKNELLRKQLKKDETITETARLKDKTDLILSKFPPAITQEKSMIFIIYLAQLSEMKLTSITFHDIALFYTSDKAVLHIDETAFPQGAAASSENEAAIPPDNAAMSENSGSKETGLGEGTSINKELNVRGYRTAITISYQTTYSGLKKCLGLIAGNKERMNVSEFTVSFDNATGNLTGMMTIRIYALDGIEGNYEEPAYDEVTIGTNNIFSTFELHAEE